MTLVEWLKVTEIFARRTLKLIKPEIYVTITQSESLPKSKWDYKVKLIRKVYEDIWYVNMKKLHLVAIYLINLFVIAPFVDCIQLDNELVSKQQRKCDIWEKKTWYSW